MKQTGSPPKPKRVAPQAAGADVRALAQEVLGSEEAAHEWLHAEALGLEFRKPIDLVGTSQGAEAVKTLLLRMQHGVYA